LECCAKRSFHFRRPARIELQISPASQKTGRARRFTERTPGVHHFTGADIAIQHVEKYWCPSFLISDFTAEPFSFPRRPALNQICPSRRVDQRYCLIS
jgi:hypothetical protein